MENEIKVKENVNKENKIFLERESFKGSDGRDFWSYFVSGKVRNRNVKVDFIPKDKGGYEPLDIIFDVTKKAELILGEEEMTSDSGKVTKYLTYKAHAVDNDGIVYECSVKPSKDSDKALFNMLLNSLHIEIKGA